VFVPNVVRSLSLSGSEGMGGSEDWTDEGLSLCVFRYSRVEDSFEISFRFSIESHAWVPVDRSRSWFELPVEGIWTESRESPPVHASAFGLSYCIERALELILAFKGGASLGSRSN
jgi:hypothetical protein